MQKRIVAAVRAFIARCGATWLAHAAAPVLIMTNAYYAGCSDGGGLLAVEDAGVPDVDDECPPLDPATGCDDCNPCHDNGWCEVCDQIPPVDASIFCHPIEKLPPFCVDEPVGCGHGNASNGLDCFPVEGVRPLITGYCCGGTCIESIDCPVRDD